MGVQLNGCVRSAVVRALTAILLVWPAMHFAFVHTHGISAWKLGGWAMYTLPSLDLFTQVRESRDGREVPIDPHRLPPRLRSELDRFRTKRTHLGRLVRPDRFAAALLRRRPNIDGVVVSTVGWSFDASTDQFVREVHDCFYSRGTEGRVEFEERRARFPAPSPP